VTDEAKPHPDHTKHDLLYEATLNESDRRAETARLRAELERRDKVARAIHVWGVLALSTAASIFYYFDHKFELHVISTTATEKASEKNASDIAALDARTKADAASMDMRTKANTQWIQDVQGEQKAFEQSQRTEGLKTTIEINNLRNDVTNIKGHR
jgi:hypothetical protein